MEFAEGLGYYVGNVLPMVRGYVESHQGHCPEAGRCRRGRGDGQLRCSLRPEQLCRVVVSC